MRGRKVEKSRLSCVYDARETEIRAAEQIMCPIYRRIYIYERAEGREVSFVIYIVGHMYVYEREGGREVSFVTYIVGYIYIYERAEGREVSFVMCV